MGWLSKLFGQCGTVRFQYTTYEGVTNIATIYVETFNIGNHKLEEHLKNAMYVLKGIRCKEIELLGFTPG